MVKRCKRCNKIIAPWRGDYGPICINKIDIPLGGKVKPKEPPPPESGYVPPKKPPKGTDKHGRIKNPNGKGWGWPAEDGGVWIPDNNMHGGAGWNVQYPGGEHKHHYPDGYVRESIAKLFGAGSKVSVGDTVVIQGIVYTVVLIIVIAGMVLLAPVGI